jgi:hypothetical protein
MIPIQSSNKTSTPHSSNSSTPWHPRAHFATNVASNNSTWLLNSGASHNVTANLNHLSLHAPYTGSDDVMIEDGTGLSITHTGLTSLLTNNSTFKLNDVLCVPDIKTNLISIYQFCVTNNVSVEFLPTCFQVKDLHTGATLVQGITKDDVYEWSAIKPSSSPIIAFSSTKTTSSNWHHHVLSEFHLNISSPLFKELVCNACYYNKSHKLPFSTSSLQFSQPLEIIFSNV